MALIKELPKSSRPREKAQRFGISLLSDNELLAIILSSGTKGKSVLEVSNDILSTYKSLNNLSRESFKNLTKIKGIDEVKAIVLQSVFEIHKRLVRSEYGETNIISNATDIYNLYKYIANYEQEHLLLIILDYRRRIIKEITLYKGTRGSMNVSFGEIIKEVLVVEGKSFILVHNHLGNSYLPSTEDIFSTSKIKSESERFDIVLLDHIIITKEGYYSFKESKKLNII